MKKNVINVLMGIFALAVLGLSGCGSGGGGGNVSDPALIQAFEWYFDNTPADYYNDGSGATCNLHVAILYSKSVAAGDIDSLSVTAPTGWKWTIPSSGCQFAATSDGQPYIITRLYYASNPQTFPLAGTWTAEIKLRNGRTSSAQRTLHEPGSTADATHQYLYTAEDWTPPTDPSQYVAALGRFPSQGYTAQYSANAGGTITTTNFSTVRSNYLNAEPRAYNMVCWLYDANNQYLGRSDTEYSTTDHSSTGLVTAGGELLITTTSTESLTGGNIDLSKVKYVSIVYLDGAQYAPSSYTTVDYRSISALVAVN